jgi:hypothetical protein
MIMEFTPNTALQTVELADLAAKIGNPTLHFLQSASMSSPMGLRPAMKSPTENPNAGIVVDVDR